MPDLAIQRFQNNNQIKETLENISLENPEMEKNDPKQPRVEAKTSITIPCQHA